MAGSWCSATRCSADLRSAEGRTWLLLLERRIDHLHLSDAVLRRKAVRCTRIQTFAQVLQLQGELKRRIELIMRHAVSRFLH